MIPAANKPAIIGMIQAVIQTERLVDITTLTVLTCTTISNPLLAGTGLNARAQMNVGTNTLLLTPGVWQNVADFRSTGDPNFLTDLFQVIAHEKRHATLASLIIVDKSVLRPGLSQWDADRAQYWTEEILANAEEIAIGKRLLPGYTVSTVSQQMIRQHWVRVDSTVVPAESTRLRNLVIQFLRTRYGFTGNCDNAITVGVVMCMENARWYSCYSGKIPGNIPAGLNLCTKPGGGHAICP